MAIRESRDCEVLRNTLDNAMDQDSPAVCCTNELNVHAGFNKTVTAFSPGAPSGDLRSP